MPAEAPGRAARRAELVEQQHARTAQREVVGDARAHHARADHGDLGALGRPRRHGAIVAAVSAPARARSSASARSAGSSLVSSTRWPSAGCANARRAACRNWRRRPICAPGDAVHGIAEHRMADRREVHADLVRAARLQLQAQQARARRAARASSKCVTAGALAAAADRHAADVVAIAADRRVDRAAARGRAAAHERDVLALDLARAHLLAERRVGLVAAREHEQAGGVAVEPVDHARPLLVVAAAQAETRAARPRASARPRRAPDA